MLIVSLVILCSWNWRLAPGLLSRVTVASGKGSWFVYSSWHLCKWSQPTWPYTEALGCSQGLCENFEPEARVRHLSRAGLVQGTSESLTRVCLYRINYWNIWNYFNVLRWLYQSVLGISKLDMQNSSLCWWFTDDSTDSDAALVSTDLNHNFPEQNVGLKYVRLNKMQRRVHSVACLPVFKQDAKSSPIGRVTYFGLVRCTRILFIDIIYFLKYV
jgi:hypothetical protein